MIDQPPEALVRGCNDPVSIGVLSDWVEEQYGFPLDLDGRSWSSDSDRNIGSGWAYGNSRGNGSGRGYGNRCPHETYEIVQNGHGDGRMHSYSLGNGNGCGIGYSFRNGNGYGVGYDNINGYYSI